MREVSQYSSDATIAAMVFMTDRGLLKNFIFSSEMKGIDHILDFVLFYLCSTPLDSIILL